MSGGPHRARRAAHRTALLVVGALVLAAYATAEPPSGGGATTVGTSGSGTTATSVSTSDRLIDRLLELDDVRPLPAFGIDTREQPVLDPQQFALATLRGPCGATVETPFDESGVFRVFRSTTSMIVEAAAEPGAEAADAFVAALRADAQPGCPPFQEQLGSAEASTIQLQSMLDLEARGDDWIGWTQEVTAASDRVGYRTVIVVADGDRLWLLAVLSPGAIPAEDLIALGDLAARRAAEG